MERVLKYNDFIHPILERLGVDDDVDAIAEVVLSNLKTMKKGETREIPGEEIPELKNSIIKKIILRRDSTIENASGTFDISKSWYDPSGSILHIESKYKTSIVYHEVAHALQFTANPKYTAATGLMGILRGATCGLGPQRKEVFFDQIRDLAYLLSSDEIGARVAGIYGQMRKDYNTNRKANPKITPEKMAKAVFKLTIIDLKHTLNQYQSVARNLLTCPVDPFTLRIYIAAVDRMKHRGRYVDSRPTFVRLMKIIRLDIESSFVGMDLPSESEARVKLRGLVRHFERKVEEQRRRIPKLWDLLWEYVQKRETKNLGGNE